MKKVIAIFAFLFVAGILAGGAYEWLSDRGVKNIWEDRAGAVAAKAEATPQPERTGESQAPEKASSSEKEHLVTNPDKICATPGCGRAVFVTYKGKELCVKCYGDAKNRDTGHE